jgi:hypothetical protein
MVKLTLEIIFTLLIAVYIYFVWQKFKKNEEVQIMFKFFSLTMAIVYIFFSSMTARGYVMYGLAFVFCHMGLKNKYFYIFACTCLIWVVVNTFYK